MASEDAHDLLYVIEDMVQDRRDDIVKKRNLMRQMQTREDCDDVRFEEAERELLRSGAVIETSGEERLQVHHFEL